MKAPEKSGASDYSAEKPMRARPYALPLSLRACATRLFFKTFRTMAASSNVLNFSLEFRVKDDKQPAAPGL